MKRICYKEKLYECIVEFYREEEKLYKETIKYMKSKKVSKVSDAEEFVDEIKRLEEELREIKAVNNILKNKNIPENYRYMWEECSTGLKKKHFKNKGLAEAFSSDIVKLGATHYSSNNYFIKIQNYIEDKYIKTTEKRRKKRSMFEEIFF